jgi:cytochrome o ubiquinol oxidase operon protein cyoD
MKQESYETMVRRYALGGIGSAVLIVLTYLIVTKGWIVQPIGIAITALLLGLAQLGLQLFTFLHIQTEEKPRWKTIGFMFSVLIIFIIVAGSIWIMMNLNYRMHLSPESMNEYMIQQNKKGF